MSKLLICIQYIRSKLLEPHGWKIIFTSSVRFIENLSLIEFLCKKKRLTL